MTLDLAASIKEARRLKGMSQAAVARQMGVSQQSVAAWENGSTPRLELAVKIAGFIEQPIEAVRDTIIPPLDHVRDLKAEVGSLRSDVTRLQRLVDALTEQVAALAGAPTRRPADSGSGRQRKAAPAGSH